ncbi:hypothetical protein KV102_14570 [Mumia sp. zg.B53]|uniref:hypothetical protein n=1 Tax=Mumia sp. zg.B21 TaxID=2855447 RepID=UPI001C6E9EA2|nr:hypothetical protein [Mumia sp. zg.B21]MBW9216060.1 hypothetical protein [Mumia sp. zg.B53]
MTKSSQQAWESAHRAALPFTLVACLLAIVTAVLSVTGVILANTADASRVAPVVVMVAGYVGFLVVMVLAMAVGNRAVRSLPEGRAPRALSEARSSARRQRRTRESADRWAGSRDLARPAGRAGRPARPPRSGLRLPPTQAEPSDEDGGVTTGHGGYLRD